MFQELADMDRFIQLVDKGAGMAYYKKELGLQSQNDIQYHLKHMSYYRMMLERNKANIPINIIEANRPTTQHEVAIVIITITTPDRAASLKKLTDSIDEKKPDYDCKIISVDSLNKGTISVMEYESKGWITLTKPRRGMCANLKDALELTNAHWILYSEDDVVINKLPTKQELLDIAELTYEGRRPGIISYTYGGYETSKTNQLDISLANEKRYITYKDYCVWFRNDHLRNDYWVEFPITFIRRDLLLSCMNYAYDKLKQHQIEVGLSRAWFAQELDRDFAKATILDIKAASVLPTTRHTSYDNVAKHILWTNQCMATTCNGENQFK